MDWRDRVEGFDWDDGNRFKNWEKQRVATVECEELFFNRPLVVADDARHSQAAPRYYALGKTNAGRRLFIAFTVRDDLIRVISAREKSRRERRIYEQEET
jgi:hypothetical protein